MNNINIQTIDTKTQCIVAKYIGQSVFKIPKDVNPSDIKEWGIKWDELTLYMKDGSEIDIQAEWGGIIQPDAMDIKRPDEITIEDKADQCCESDDESDEEDETNTET
jgi:hypothetical protein